MSYHFRPAIKSEAKPLIGLYAESGAGKTYSALLLAKGYAEDMSKVGMIETESGRGEVFADDPVVGGYQVLSIRDDFSPSNYGAAITAAGHAGLQVLIIDSASHEWEGAGGVLGMAAKNQAEGKKGPIVWQQPKMQHQREFMLKLMQTPVPVVIVCMRAKYPMKEEARNGKKEWVRSETLEPKQADDILFEMMVHGWIDQQHKLHVTKYTKQELKDVFIDNAPISVETGARLRSWAHGGGKVSPKKESATNGDFNQEELEEEKVINQENLEVEAQNQVELDYIAAIHSASSLEDLKDIYTSAYKWAEKNKRTMSASKFTKAKDKRKEELGAEK